MLKEPEAWFNPAYWRLLNPRCTVSDKRDSAGPAVEIPAEVELAREEILALKKRIDGDGYFDL
jgi:hypothetical protein